MKRVHDNDAPDNRDRRTALKTLFLGGGSLSLSALPAQWIKPVVDTVLLPAHAQTSPDSGPALNGFTVSPLARSPGLLDLIVPKAYASLAFPPTGGVLCIQSNGGGWIASFDTGSEVATGSGDFNVCTSLSCGLAQLDINVTAANEDGSFDFVLAQFSSVCGSEVVSGTTNEPCSLGTCVESD